MASAKPARTPKAPPRRAGAGDLVAWDDARLFLSVAETGSLTQAASLLRVAQPTVSRRLAELESRLGEPLFRRSVEGAALTAFGERLVEPASRMAEWAAELERAAERRDTGPRGVVRITAPPGVAFELLAPFAAELRAELPELRLEVVATVQYLDLARREADLALRTQRPTQRDLVVLASLSLASVPFVSKGYAARLGKKPRLADVAFVGWAPPFDHLSPNPELARLIPGWQPSFASDDFLVLLRAAEVGLGAIFLGRVENRFARDAGLVELDVGLPPVPAGLHLVAARSALDIPRVRAVADRIARELEQTAKRAKRHRPKRV
jgi:DNA-binding transcriptional LysR family regulator